MGILIGPTPWWQINVIAVSSVGTTLPDGSRIICKAGGTAWIVAPSNTEVSQSWNNSTSTLVGNKLCVCDWPTLNTRLINCGFNPGDWFVPSSAQLQNPGHVCRTFWPGGVTSTGPCCWYWSSTEINSTQACRFRGDDGGMFTGTKTDSFPVRAFRCVTY
jgi:hypothetical protein